MIPLEEAQARVLALAAGPLPAAEVPVGDALGLVLAEGVVAGEAVPPFANTAMDGYAVQAADTAGAAPDHPVPLRVTGLLAAGADPTGFRVGPGEAVQIMTGAPIPDGADAVVMVERTRRVSGIEVAVEAEAAAGDHIRPAGEDLAPGQEVAPAGTQLRPGHLGVLASVGRLAVPVHRRPRVGVLSTGDELVEGRRTLRPGQIRDSNRHTLLALVRRAGGEPVDLGIAPDDAGFLRARFAEAARRCDLVLTSGGVSMGELDFVKQVLDELAGADGMSWMQVAIRPAKPLSAGQVDGVPVLALPGNPVSSMVSFELFARPVLRRLLGHPDHRLHRPRTPAVAGEDLRRRPDGKIHFVRVTVARLPGDTGAGPLVARSSGGQASNLLHAMALADALAVVPDGDGVSAGDPVELLMLEPEAAL